MNKLLRLCALALPALLALPVHAVQRTFVASFGNDANPCSIASPCRGIARALTQTDPSGEVIVLDSAGYGAFTITQSVSVIAPDGVYAGISVFPGQDGITLNPGPTEKVALRGLTVNGQGGNRGILVQSGDEIHISRCTVKNMNDAGVRIEGGTNIFFEETSVRSNAARGVDIVGGNPRVVIADSRITRNIFRGIRMTAGGDLVLYRVLLDRNEGAGVELSAAAGVVMDFSMRDSAMIMNHGTAGYTSFSTGAGSEIRATVENVSAVQNARGYSIGAASEGINRLVISRSEASLSGEEGIFATGANTEIHLRDSTVIRNRTWGLRGMDGAVIRTCLNNLIALNGTPDVGTSPVGCNQ